MGDSLSAEFGLPPESGWVSLLARQLQQRPSSYQVINASISGETTLGGRKRIERALDDNQPDFVIIALGGNDGLQGQSLPSIYDNLEAIIQSCLQHHATPILAGMQLPPNYGISYTRKFREIYSRLATTHQLPLIPFLLQGFADQPQFFQVDGIHPTEQAQEKILENVWTILEPLLQSTKNLKTDPNKQTKAATAAESL